MGGGDQPGSTGRRTGGPPGDPEADALEQYGRGTKDPLTGLYEWYEDVSADLQGQGEGFSVLSLVENWPLIAADFASEYGIRLALPGLSWHEFSNLLTGLLTAETRTFRRFTADTEGAKSHE